MTTIRFTKPARSLFVKVRECLSDLDKERFSKILADVYDKKITGEDQLSEYNITEKEINDVLVLGNFVSGSRLKLLLNP